MKRRTFLKHSAATGLAATLGANLAQAAPEPVSAPRDPMKVLLWCWDARMTWDDEPDTIQLKMAAAEKLFPYPKKPESYQVGFRRLIDYCAKTGIWGVIIWGFLRDSHGGVKEAKELCRYAADHGVKILPGVGLCAYGGYYYDGDHQFNLNTYLKKYPDRASTAHEDSGSGREVHPVLDPSLKANQDWWRDGLDWMHENFAIGGINYEMGDFIVNPSDSAVAARKSFDLDTNGNIQDIVVATSALLDHAYTQHPDATYINALYRGYQQIKNFPKIPYADALHDKAVWEYTMLRLVREKGFPEAYKDVPMHRQYGYFHWFNASMGSQNNDFTEAIKDIYPKLHQLGFEFAGTYGEIGVKGSDVADANYRAQVQYAKGG